MDLTSYVDNLRQELAVAAEAGGEESRALAERLTAPLESAARLTLLSALSDAADEITRELAPGSVEVRLRGLNPGFVVTPAPSEPAVDEETTSSPNVITPPTPPVGDEGNTARINLRLPEHLKLRVEEAASQESLSVNAWLVRAVTGALGHNVNNHATTEQRDWGGGHRYTGWVR